MHQVTHTIEPVREQRPVTVTVPQEWDGIGQALRAAYREHRAPPSPICDVLAQLKQVD